MPANRINKIHGIMMSNKYDGTMERRWCSGQITSEWAKLHQSGPSYIRVGQVTSEWAKLHQSGPSYIIVRTSYCTDINDVQSTVTYNATSKLCK